ncbi:hypothetical protein GOFOIKOB_5976 [Methylobacterium tardum]|uniref:Uncharacterized protein n=1 Tax=Methylobacterium tardum TaxID=374432 RepID=A0AA37T6Z3_9HYPH|nr:hypothetical protein [Methylobacterium tardum]URD39532.1 hypothetical protein M6G65_14670 [Methylobacterium tardum]GJE52901.1 hypothetical protein GOFOIKOB_5976 [Methylobacterium tardum]GLS68219.1 hypothetical protein GCM10007890_02310 [Methylobacterium tardum]
MADNTQALVRLAEALGIPIEAFTRPEAVSGEQITQLRETAELLEAWARIDDKQARRRCLSYVKSAAQRSGSR